MEGGKLTHSHSQPGGMDRTPPGTPKKGGKMLAVRVQMLDDSITMFQVQAKALGRVLFEQVCKQLHLLESDYFGLEYQEVGGTKYWLDLEKPLSRQIGLSLIDTLVRFCVKFYTPDPSQLEEEFTRYLFCLQIKRDLSQGLLQCNDNTAALMASYIVQAECGDYVVEDYPDHRYLSSYKFVPNQDHELERRIMENHKKHAGQSPAEADLNLLETARRCELYGIKMHPAKDHEGVPLNLAVAHMGIVVFQNYTKINTFSWAKIRKISFKRKRFLVKLHPEGYGYYKDTVEFFFEGRNECKNFWKKCVENHGFFRCSMVKRVPRQKTRVLSRGSSFRYSGRTQKQIVEFVRENYVKRQTFQRSQSFRHSSSAHSSVANVGTSISAHPLLPLGDNAVAGTPASLSCGSMTLTSSPLHTADIHAGGSPSPPLTTSVSPGTSVTSSPQHFYPQETPYRRPGHQPTRLKHPHVQSLHTTSPLQSPTSAATAANNRSANHTNNNVIVDDNEIANSRISLKSPEFNNFNDVYSNCYDSLRNLRNVTDNNIDTDDNKNKTKSDLSIVSRPLVSANSKSSESIKSSSKKIKSTSNKKQAPVERYTWYRSASCKDLYHEENSVEVTETKNEKNLREKETTYEKDGNFQIGFDSPITRYDDTRRTCYSAVVSKTPSVDRTGDVITDTKIYSSSYPGTTSSLSTESAEGEPSERVIDMIDINGSQEEIVLSHDDLSHDSYELLEREFDDFDNSVDESSKSKSRRVISESDRTRSCSWGSDRGTSPLDSRSSEKGVSPVDSKRENGFRSLERSKTPKHKSEADFRSLDRKSPKHRDDDRKSPKGSKTSMNKINEDYRKYGTTGRRRSREYEYDNRSCVSDTRRRSKEIDDDVFRTPERISPLDSRVFSPKDFEDRDIHRSLEREARQRKRSKEYDQDSFNSLERRKYQDRRRSREELEIFPMDSEEEFIREEQRRAEERRRMERKREKDRRDREERFHEGIKEKEVRQLERRKSIEEDKQKRLREEELARKAVPKHFEEPNAKKYERVVSNQFGGYSEFLTRDSDYELMLQERKVLENYEKVCQVGRMAKEMERNERASKYGFSSPSDPNKFVNAQFETPQTVPIAQDFKPDKLTDIAKTTKDSSSKISQSETGKPQVGQFKEFNAKTKGGVVLGFTASPKGSPKLGKAPVERTKSDPYDSSKNLRRNVLMHQKSIDLTPQDSGEVTSDYDNDDMIKKTSRSEHDIPYILHKRHCMNGTAKDLSSVSAKSGISVTSERKAKDIKPKPMEKKPEVKKATLEEPKLPKPRPSSPQIIESKKAAGVEIINLDEPDDEDLSDDIYATIEPKKPPTPPLITKPVKPIVAKKPILTSEGKVAPKSPVRREIASKKEEPPRAISPVKKPEEPIYAQVIKGKVILDKKDAPKKVPPEPPKRTTPIAKPEEKKIEPKPPERTTSLLKSPGATAKKIPPEPPKRTTSAQKLNIDKSPEPRDKTPSPTKPVAEVKEDIKKPSPKVEPKEETKKPQPGPVKGKADLTIPSIAPHKREESLILFARTRLGLSEGSAFTPVTRQGNVGSPTSARRTKSLDAPVVSVHRLPAADAFSSKDDTVDAPEEDVVKSAAAKAAEFFKVDLKKVTDDKTMKAAKAQAMFDTTISTESEMDAFLPEDMEIDKNFKEVISQSKVDIPFPEEKVLDAVRSKRLLSKIDSVDGIDSEGDLDSSKLHEPPPIPPDRLVNLPESVRFPSVRQISGQTSEESADGWDPKEVKVKRRTPRRSTGREDPDTGIKESVVWDSKDDELPDDDVWDENIIYTAKHEGPIVTDAVVASEYLKRGSCGQSIDDDNLSTPMKESSPEHWVSVDDLPEAIEREERLLREQEKILREKILNEKLKRELNLDTIDIEERYYEYKSDSFRSSFEDVPLPVLPGKDKFKGHSLDTYELTEKKLRERCTNKNPSLDEHILRDDPIKSYLAMTSTLDVSDKSSSYENVPKIPKYERGLDYIKCKVVNDVDEIDQFGDNDDDLEEFVVVLDENLGDGKEGREVVWDDDNFSRRTVSKEESLISVPEEFKDVEEEIEEIAKDVEDKQEAYPEIRLDNENQPSERRKTGEEHILESQLLEEKLRLMADEKVKLSEDKIHDDGRLSPYDTSSRRSSEDPRRSSMSEDPGRLSPYDGSRRGSEERRRLSASEDTGRLSPYDNSSRRSSDDPRRLSASDDAGRLSPFDDSRRGSEDPRRLSTSEDSRKYSISEDSVRVSTSVSEETRRRLSSTEETRRKRASLTKQCSVGVDSLSDDLIPGIQECSSSFEQDEKDVFESVPPVDAEPVKADAEKTESDTEKKDMSDAREVRKLAIEVSEDTSDTKEPEDAVVEEQVETDVLNHLAPPKGERELSRETEDSMDYGEGDFKEIRDVVKEKDISDGLTCDSDSLKSGRQSSKLPSSFEKSESSDKDELRFIDDKRGSTPEIIVGSSKETAAMSVVVVNEGIAVLNKIVERDRLLSENTKTQSLPRGIIVTDTDKEAAAQEQRHTLPKRVSKQKPALAPKPDYVHRKLAKAVPNIKTIPSPIAEITYLDQANIFESQDSSQDSDVDRLCEVSLLAQIQSQIARRNLSDAGRRLRRDVIGLDSESKSDVPLVKVFEEVEGSPSAKEDKMVWRQRTSLEEDDKPDEEQNSKEKKSPTGKPPEMENEKIKKEQKNEVEKPKEEKRTPDQEKRDSGEDVSSSSSAPPHPKRELSSTWRPFLLESSGSSSLEEGWLPPDDAAHLADEEETSSTSNNQQDDSLHDDVIDYPTQIGYPVLNMSSAEMMVGGYGSVFALSRTLSRISERSTTSEQERSDIEDDITKPSSHSVSIEEESIMSSDHQPSLSSDPPSPKASSSKIPDLPDDRSPIPENFIIPEDKTPVSEPFGDVIPPPLPDDDWPSPPDSSGVFDTPVVSHIETFYMEIHPEEAYKVVVAELQNEENSSSDENHTLQEEGEFLHLSSDNLSISTTTTTQDGTVIVPVRPKNMRTNSVSEDTSVMSTSDWSSSTTIRPRTNSNFGTTEDLSDWTRSTTLQDGSSSVKAHSKQGTSDEVSEWSSSTHRKQNQSAYSKSDEINSDNLGSRSEWQPSTKSGDTSQGATVSDWSSSASKFYSESYSSTLEYESSKPKTPSKSKPPKLKSPTSKNMGFFETPISKVRSPTSQAKFFERTEKGSSTRSPTSHSESTSPKNHGRFFESPSHYPRATEYYEVHKTKSPTKSGKFFESPKSSEHRKNVCTPYYSNVADVAEKSYFGRYDTGSLERGKIHSSRKCFSYYSVARSPPSEDDSSSNDAAPAPSSNTIPRASKRTKKRHRVAMDLQIRDGKIVAPPKTRTTVVENSDSDRSSPREYRSSSKETRRKQSDV